jgi:hypothetical protein
VASNAPLSLSLSIKQSPMNWPNGHVRAHLA